MLEKFIDLINFGSTDGTVAPAASGDPAAQGAGGFLGSWLFIIVIFVLFWLLLILPQRRQEKKHKEMMSKLEKGDKIVNQAGIIGKIVSISNDKIRIRTGDNTQIDITKGSIAAVLSKASSEEEKEEKEESKDKEEK